MQVAFQSWTDFSAFSLGDAHKSDIVYFNVIFHFKNFAPLSTQIKHSNGFLF